MAWGDEWTGSMVRRLDPASAGPAPSRNGNCRWCKSPATHAIDAPMYDVSGQVRCSNKEVSLCDAHARLLGAQLLGSAL